MDAKPASFDRTVFIVDAMPLLYRGHFVFLRNPRLTSSGVNTSALVVFGSTLAQILADFNPSHLAVAFDSRTPTFRHERYPAYKAHRQKIPEDLLASIPMAVALCEALRIPVLREDGFEADDLMGTLARQAARSGLQSVLVTPDKDVAQLVDDRTRLFRPGTRSQEGEWLGPDEVCAHWVGRERGVFVGATGSRRAGYRWRGSPAGLRRTRVARRSGSPSPGGAEPTAAMRGSKEPTTRTSAAGP